MQNMTKKIFIIFILNFISIQLVSSQNCNYEDYYRRIELARKECRDENFKEANKLYKIAFDNIDFPLGTDLRIALKVAEETGDKIQMEKISVQLAKGGIPLKFFKKFESYKWYKTFYEQYPSYQKSFNDNFDLEFRKSLISLEKLDKDVNSHFHEWRTRKENHPIDTLVSQMKKVSVKFQRIVEKFGFPSEQKFGYYFRAGSVVELPTFVLLIHIYERGELLYIEQLNELACKGYITQSTADQLRNIRGLGNSTGIKQNMEACRQKFRGNG